LSRGFIHMLRSSVPARALMPQRHRLSSGLAALDALLDGGIVRGRISELIGPIGSGRTTIAACFVAVATRAGEVVAWLENTRSFAPAAIAASSASLERVLWVLVDDPTSLSWNQRAGVAALGLPLSSRRLKWSSRRADSDWLSSTSAPAQRLCHRALRCAWRVPPSAAARR
jgi:ABC-type glutathione transport system ATPase component